VESDWLDNLSLALKTKDIRQNEYECWLPRSKPTAIDIIFSSAGIDITFFASVTIIY